MQRILSLAVVCGAIAIGEAALAQSGPPQAVPAMAPVAPTLSVSGFDRIRVMSMFNPDLNAASAVDSSLMWADIRSYLTLEGKLDRARLVTSVDLAGTDWDEGALFGYDNSARQRVFDVQVRHLFMDYAFEELGLVATLGRQPAMVGYGIVSSINRDAIKLVKSLPDAGSLAKQNLTFNWVQGAKGNTTFANHLPVPADGTAQAGRSGTFFTNDPSGAWHSLSTFLLAYNAAPLPNSRLQAFVAQQVDTSEASVYPQKRFVDLNGEWKAGALTLGGEAVHLSGASPAAAGRRAPLDSFALYGTGRYRLAALELGLSAARGGGDNDPGDGLNTGFQSLFINESSLAYNHLFSDELHGFDGTDASIGRGAGLNNVTFLQPNLTYHFSDDLTGFASLTRHWATAPVRAGSGVLGNVPTASTQGVTGIGDELDLRLNYRWGPTLFYGAASTFVPGEVYANTGFANAVHKLEAGTEVRF